MDLTIITFIVPIEKEIRRIDKNGEEITKNICYILQFIDSTKFMARSSSNLFNNLSEGIHKIKCEHGCNDKNCETCRIKYKYCHCILEYTNFKDDLIEYKCLCCNKNIQQQFNQKLKERFFNMITISLFYCSKKVFILMNIWMIGKNSMKHHYLRKSIFIVT